MPKTRKAQIFERDELDWYVEPARVTAQLLAVEKFSGPVHDPSCGTGSIVLGLIEEGYEATGSDVRNRLSAPVSWWDGTRDFLVDTRRHRNLCMNPPYFSGKGTESFIRHALTVATVKVCVFVDRRFLTGKTRANGLYTEHPPTRVWEITPRPSCPPGAWLAAGNIAGGGTADYCWLVWDLAVPSGRTELGWLRGEVGAASPATASRPLDTSLGNQLKPRRRRS